MASKKLLCDRNAFENQSDRKMVTERIDSGNENDPKERKRGGYHHQNKTKREQKMTHIKNHTLALENDK